MTDYDKKSEEQLETAPVETAPVEAEVLEDEPGVSTADGPVEDAEFCDLDEEEEYTEPDEEIEDDEELDEADEEAGEEADDEPAAETIESKGKPAPAAPPQPKKKNLRWDTMFLLLLTCITLIRLGYLYVVPLDLGPDESYYWDWSRQLDLGYYSKPPMIAWINAAATALFGVSAQAVRMPAVIFGALGLIGMYLCGRRIFNGEIAFWAVAAWLATPATAALGLIMATDVLLISFWSLALYTLWRSIEGPKTKPFWWLLTMIPVGLGSLSKQMMLVFPVLMFCYLLFSADRKQILSRWPWIMTIGSLLFLIPPLWWNFQHDWITFKHTAHHVEPVGRNVLDHFKTFAEFAGSQLGLISPITGALLAFLILSLLLRCLRWPRETKFLFFFGAVGLFGFVGISFKQSINPNWPAAFYPATMLLLAAWGRGKISAGFLDGLRKWFPRGVKLGIALTVIAYLLPFIMQLSFLPLGKKDPGYRIKGWKELGQQVGAELQQQPRPTETFILSPLRSYPAEVAFYAPGHPRTYKWPGTPPKVSSQYDLWPGPTDKLGWDALILHDAGTSLPADLIAAFEKVVPLGDKSIPIGAAGERKYSLWRGENLLSWPEPN